MADKNQRPFDRDYVLRITRKHMLKSVEISINKTLERVQEFAGDQKKSAEVFETLANLQAMRKQLNDFHSSSECKEGQ